MNWCYIKVKIGQNFVKLMLGLDRFCQAMVRFIHNVCWAKVRFSHNFVRSGWSHTEVLGLL